MAAVTTYDFTSFGEDPEAVKALLNAYCKKWDFQQEECPTTGKKHFQGRFHLKVKERITGVIKKLPGWHLSITAKENINNNYYVTKEDTRVAGPWSSEDKERYIPRQIREIEALRPWQEAILKNAGEWDKRTINIIYDTTGNIGKTTLCTYLGVHGIGRKIPYSNDYRDIMRMVMDTATTRLYLFDLPRAIKKEHMYQFYAAVEEIKNGYAYDDRYNFREKWFDCPNIWIFTNTLPEWSLMSRDRWKVWNIVEDNLVAQDELEI